MRTKSGHRRWWEAPVYQDLEIEPGGRVQRRLGTYWLSPPLPERRVVPEVRLLRRDDGVGEGEISEVLVSRVAPASRRLKA